MQLKTKYGIALLLLASVVLAGWQFYPYLLFQVSEWQRAFNLELSAALKNLQAHRHQAGLSLIAVSFLYGVFHAVGPGHGKFILTSYLSFEQTKLPQAVKITLLSAFVQGVVAVLLVSVIVVAFTLSRQHFNLTLKWVERGSFIIMVLFGLYWVYQAFKGLRVTKPKLKVKGILQTSNETRPLAPRFSTISHQHSEHCGCGHKHLPSATELAQATDWKSLLMLVFSIGLRPCSGAILVLFLAYTLDIYEWGVISALVMAAGTGLTLSIFAYFVLFARQRAVQAGKWYLSLKMGNRLSGIAKLFVGFSLVLFGILLFHSSLIDTSNSILFKR